jgi:hypothetical protein
VIFSWKRLGCLLSRARAQKVTAPAGKKARLIKLSDGLNLAGELRRCNKKRPQRKSTGRKMRARGTNVRSVTTARKDGLIVEVAVIKVTLCWPITPLLLGMFKVTVTRLYWPGTKVTGVAAVIVLHG